MGKPVRTYRAFPSPQHDRVAEHAGEACSGCSSSDRLVNQTADWLTPGSVSARMAGRCFRIPRKRGDRSSDAGPYCEVHGPASGRPVVSHKGLSRAVWHPDQRPVSVLSPLGGWLCGRCRSHGLSLADEVAGRVGGLAPSRRSPLAPVPSADPSWRNTVGGVPQAAWHQPVGAGDSPRDLLPQA